MENETETKKWDDFLPNAEWLANPEGTSQTMVVTFKTDKPKDDLTTKKYAKEKTLFLFPVEQEGENKVLATSSERLIRALKAIPGGLKDKKVLLTKTGAGTTTQYTTKTLE